MSDLLQQGAAALKAGDKAGARRLFGRAIRENRQDARAWLRLSDAVENNRERLICLHKVLAIDPGNKTARRAIDKLHPKAPRRPAPKSPPAKALRKPQREPKPEHMLRPELKHSHLFATLTDRVQSDGLQDIHDRPDSSPRPASTQPKTTHSTPGTSPARHTPQFSPIPLTDLDHSKSLDKLSPEVQRALKGYVQLIAQELRNGKKRQVIVEQLTGRGFPRQAIEELVKEVAQVVNRVQIRNYRKRMGRGLLITIAGVLGACITTYFIDGGFGGISCIVYLVVLGGLVDFVGGLIGWLAHRV
jgi:hypothetical protein